MNKCKKCGKILPESEKGEYCVHCLIEDNKIRLWQNEKVSQDVVTCPWCEGYFNFDKLDKTSDNKYYICPYCYNVFELEVNKLYLTNRPKEFYTEDDYNYYFD